jgi:sugar phosphate isomerase/epimerase
MMLEFNDEMHQLLRHVHVNVPWKILPGYLDRVLRYRLNLEIGFEGEDLDRAARSDIHSTARRLLGAGCQVSLHGPFWDLNPGSIDSLIRQMSRFRLQQFLDLVDVFHPIQVVCHTGYDPRHHQGHRQHWLDRSIAAWEPMVKRAEISKVPLLLENVWEYDPHLHREVFEAIPSPYFGFCLDVGHQHSFSKTDLAIWLQVLSGFLKEIHLHDNDGSGDAHLPVGQGNIDFGLLFGFLKENEKSPLLTLEPHREEHVGESLEGLLHVLGDVAWGSVDEWSGMG